ncbi:tetratricopeptide repeat protein [Candidatus Bipolaricaulota bacterium]|nr:tetratricopeptide repeat protein [Candidatus Bipolaricaulota bacterium]
MDEERRLSAIMITDIVGYTLLGQTNEDLSLELLQEHDAILRPLFASHGGRVVKAMGDGFLVEFASALEATRCAIAIQEALHARNASHPPERRIRIRIGVHVGDVVHRQGDLFGDGVNITSRIAPLAEPEGVCISAQVYDHVWNKIHLPLASMGKQALKNVRVPTEVYCVVFPWSEVRPEDPRPVDRTRIAVLPLTNISPDPADAFFADGMTEELIFTLSRIRGLRVIAQTSVMKYKGTQKSVAEIGQELRVATVLEGSVRKVDHRVRINLQLVDTQSEEHLWSEAYDRQLEDVLAIQSEIARKVAEVLEVKLLAGEERRLQQRAARDVDIYMLYLKGRHFWNQRSESGLKRAIEIFRDVIAADPHYALAYAGLADSYSVLASQGHLPLHEAIPKAKEAAQKALELDENLAEAHTSLALIEWLFEHALDRATARFKRAIEQNPNYATARHWYANLLSDMGRTSEALAEMKRALALDPLSPIINMAMSGILWASGQFSEALDQHRRAQALAADFVQGHLSLASVLQTAGKWAEAEAELNKALDLDPNSSTVRRMYAEHLLYLGRFDEALETLHKVLVMEPDSPVANHAYGQALLLARQYEEAVAQLVRTLDHDPEGIHPRVTLGIVYTLLGRYEQALEAFRQAEARLAQTDRLRTEIHACRIVTYAGMGEMTTAGENLKALEVKGSGLGHAFMVAGAHIALGHLDEGLAWLERSYQTRDPGLRLLKVHPWFDGARSDPRFQDYLAKMGFPPEEGAALPHPKGAEQRR